MKLNAEWVMIDDVSKFFDCEVMLNENGMIQIEYSTGKDQRKKLLTHISRCVIEVKP